MRRRAREADELIDIEARKRDDCLSNKQIAERTGETLKYVANRIAYVRRQIAIEIEIDSRGTNSQKSYSD